jgi:hypothetical protein
MSLTFKNLQDKVLGWLDETGDSTVIIANVKEAIAAANAKRAGSHEWPFMVSGASGTLTPGVVEYDLALDINTLLSIRNTTRGINYRQVPFRHFLQGETIVDAFVFDGNTVTFLFEVTAADTIEYRYYRTPIELEDDNDTPDIPYPYSRILIYDALIELGLYSEDISPAKIQRWTQQIMELEVGLYAAYLSGPQFPIDKEEMSDA